MTVVVEKMSLGDRGLTVMLKDNIDVGGFPTRASSRALQDVAPATEHADVVRGLLEGGFQLTAKVSMHELAFGTTGINHHTGTPVNPLYPERIPGGSSSSSATAVAGGLCDIALGTDTGGSVRIPACCCGVYGLKPTFGRVSRKGVLPSDSSLDCVGPLAASLPMLISAMRAIDPGFAELPQVGPLQVGLVSVEANPEVLDAVSGMLNAAGVASEAVELPLMADAYAAGLTVINRENWDAFGYLVDTGTVADDVAGRLLAAGQTTDDALDAAEQVRAAFTAQVDELLARYPVLALPTMPDYPLRLEEAADTRAVLGMTALVRPFNLSGHPALTIPLVGASGLPVGLQLVAPRGADEFLLAFAQALVDQTQNNDK